MGTRGAFGFYKDGKGKITYNHFDSYPEWLGVKILGTLKKFSIKQIKEAFDNIILVNEHEKPNKKQIKECREFSNLNVNRRSYEDWYCLLRKAQGDIGVYLNGNCRYMIDSEDFLKDSLFCEYGYVANLDKKVLEIWIGFQKGIQKNRYKVSKVDEQGYGNCALVKEYPLNKLPSEKKFLEDLKNAQLYQAGE